MKNRKVIDRSHFGINPPVVAIVVIYLLLDKFHAPGWLWGAIGVFLAIIWIVAIVDIFNREEIKLKELS